jgi:hypothetical protein
MAQTLATLGDFKDTFPEFAGVLDALCQRALDDASDRVAPGVYLKQLNRAHCLMAAHILVTSPWGLSARLSGKGGGTQFTVGQTTYSFQLKEIQAERAAFIGCT